MSMQCFHALALLAGLGVSFVPVAQAQLVFDNGMVNTLNAATGDPAVAVVVRNSIAGDATTLQVADGASIGGGSGASIQVTGISILEMSGGNATGDLVLAENAHAVVTGGRFADDLLGSGNAILDLRAAANGDDATFTGSSTLRVFDGGRVGDDVFIRNSAHLEMSGGLLPDEVNIENSATARFTGGRIGDDLNPLGDSVVRIDSLEIVESIDADGRARLEIDSVRVGLSINLLANNVATIRTAEIGEGISTAGNARLTADHVDFGSVAGVSAGLNSSIKVYSGTGADFGMNVASGATVLLQQFQADSIDAAASVGATLDLFSVRADEFNLSATTEADVRIAGGSLLGGELQASSLGTITIYGDNFTVNGQPRGFGPISTVAGRLSGDLAFGGKIDLNFSRQFFPISAAGQIILAPSSAVPEPAALVAACAGLALLGTFARKNR